MNSLNIYELQILDFIREHLSCKFLDTVLPYITRLADGGVFWIALAVILLFFKRTRKAGLMMGMSLVMGLLVGNCILKPLVARTRPYVENPNVTLLISALSDYSFPSGHTLASFEGAGVLMLTHRKSLGIPALVLAVIIALSRLYLYVHYPTDVLAGALLGIIFAYASYRIVSFLFKKYGKANEAQ